MPRETLQVDIAASPARVFDLIHDYPRRLEWDTILSEARLLGGATQAGLGVKSRCVGGWRSAFVTMDTVYVTFKPGELAAVRLLRPTFLFARFAATLRHEALPTGGSRTTYIYSFRARPSLLTPILEPIVNVLLRREVKGRLRALKLFLER